MNTRQVEKLWKRIVDKELKENRNFNVRDVTVHKAIVLIFW